MNILWVYLEDNFAGVSHSDLITVFGEGKKNLKKLERDNISLKNRSFDRKRV